MRLFEKLALVLIILLPLHIFSQSVPAEFEKQEGIILTWFLKDQLENYAVDSVHLAMVESLIDDNVIYINYQNRRHKTKIEKLLSTKNIDRERIRWIRYDIRAGSYPRDYGPEWIYNNGKLNIIDMNWNFYGYLPDKIKFSRLINHNLESYDRYLAGKLKIDTYKKTKLISEGGGKEFNGKGVLMVVEQTELNRNPKFEKQQIEDEYKRVFNVKKIVWLPKPTYEDENMFKDYIVDSSRNIIALRSASANGHIDEFCRFVSPNKILLAEVSQKEADENYFHKINKERLDACYNILKQEKDTEGNPFTIIRIPIAELMFIKAPKESGVYNNIFSMKKATQLTRLIDGSDFPKNDFFVLPALSYCNFVIANNVILVAKYWKQGLPETIKAKDKQAFEVLKVAFPDKKVIAIDPIAINLGGGGLHCNTRHIPAMNK